MPFFVVAAAVVAVVVDVAVADGVVGIFAYCCTVEFGFVGGRCMPARLCRLKVQFDRVHDLAMQLAVEAEKVRRRQIW